MNATTGTNTTSATPCTKPRVLLRRGIEGCDAVNVDDGGVGAEGVEDEGVGDECLEDGVGEGV